MKDIIKNFDEDSLDYYIPKSLALISDCPIFDEMSVILNSINKNFIQGLNTYPIDLYLVYLSY